MQISFRFSPPDLSLPATLLPPTRRLVLGADRVSTRFNGILTELGGEEGPTVCMHILSLISTEYTIRYTVHSVKLESGDRTERHRTELCVQNIQNPSHV